MDYIELRNHAYDAIEIIGKLESEEIEKIEVAIFNSFPDSEEVDITNEYKAVLYQVVGDVINGKCTDEIIEGLSKEYTGWKHKSFDSMKMRQDEQDEFIQNPFEVEEGVLECRCGSKRVYSYQKQTRGSDEPSTTFAECVACKSKWQYSG